MTRLGRNLFMMDCASRIKGRVQVSTDGHRAYLEAVEGAFGMDCDYAMLIKVYGLPEEEEARRYSRMQCTGCEVKVISGDPASKAYQHELHRTLQFKYQNDQSPLYAIDKRVFKKVSQP